MASPRKKDRPPLPMGRPPKYKPEYCEQMLKFFGDAPMTRKEKKLVLKKGEYEEVEVEKPGRLPTFQSFAHSIDVCMDTLTEWSLVYPEFSATYKKCKEIQQNFLIQHTLIEDYAQPFAIFMMKACHGWKDRENNDQVDTSVNVNLNYKLEK